MNFSTRVIVFLLGFALAVAQMSGMTNLISGEVTNSATWTGTNLLTGTVVIRSNAVVTIEAGASDCPENS